MGNRFQTDPANSCNHAVITGASSGLGAALAFEFASHGTRFLTLTGRDADRLEATAATCRKHGAMDVKTEVCDVQEEATMFDMLERADRREPVDLVIANAGMGGQDVISNGATEPGALAREVMATNVFGVINTVTPLIETFVERRRGRIGIVSSVAGLHGLAESPAYCASKASVRIYGHGLRRRLRHTGVSVSVFTAGFIDTPMARSLPFSRPFTVSAQAAAHRIRRGVERRIAEDIFPWQMRLTSGALSALPRPVVDHILWRGAKFMTQT
ncbi:MAG: SDR family NAD(P)-dependent oxidoreductase [Pseudomonadota bacterium]